MRRKTVLVPLLAIAAASAAYPQSISTDDNVGTEGQLVSGVATGTPPLVVSSTSKVAKLHADRIDGLEGADLALEADLQTAEALLVALQAQVDALGAARVARTGLSTCYDEAGTVIDCTTGIGPGQDGDLQAGVSWPNPRFTNNGDGTVTDNLTDLVWLEDADCFGGTDWAAALASANGLFDGSTNDPGGGDCGLSDGSVHGQWRLPHLRELLSLFDHSQHAPALSNSAGTGQWSSGDPFTSVVSLFSYWSSTTSAGNKANAWKVLVSTGGTGVVAKTSASTLERVWPVRSGS